MVVLRTLDRSDLSGETDFLLEREVIFANGGLRVRHTETGTGEQRRLVWRELLPASSRTWVADWRSAPGEDSAHSIGYGWHRPTHETFINGAASGQAIVGPLELLHGMRSQPLSCSDRGLSATIVDPRSASIVEVERAFEAGLEGGSALSVQRLDGSRVFEAAHGESSAGPGALTALQFGGGGETATEPIDRAAFERLARRWSVESRRPYEAALSSVRRRGERGEAYWTARQKLFDAGRTQR